MSASIVYLVQLRTPQAAAVGGMMFGEKTPATDDTGAVRCVRVRDDGADTVEMGPLLLRRTGRTSADAEIPEWAWAHLLEFSKTAALLSVLAAHWKPECAQPLFAALRDKGFKEERAEHVVQQVAKVAGATVQLTKDCPEDRRPLLDAGVPEDWINSREPDADLTELNEEYAYVVDDGEVMRTYDGRRVTMDVAAFKNALRNRAHVNLVFNPETKKIEAKQVPIADWWMAHPLRRTYNRCEFLPGRLAPPRGIYNTWAGFAVEPRPGDCSRFKALVRDVI